MADSSRISPTAHYTSYVWYENGMSHRALTTRLGAVLHAALRPMNLAYERLGTRPSLDQMLLARHRVIDHLLERAIAAGEVEQVIEIAAGMSPRGFRFSERSPGLTYIEGDLPDMALRKRGVLDGAHLRGPSHHVVTLDALREGGDDSLAAIATRWLDPGKGTAIITEGLLGYFDLDAVRGMWRRIARCLAGFPRGLYLSDLNMQSDMAGMRGARTFRVLLEAFARGRLHLHFHGAEEAAAELRAAGFTTARLHEPAAFDDVEVPGRDRGHVVQIIEARP